MLRAYTTSLYLDSRCNRISIDLTFRHQHADRSRLIHHRRGFLRGHAILVWLLPNFTQRILSCSPLDQLWSGILSNQDIGPIEQSATVPQDKQSCSARVCSLFRLWLFIFQLEFWRRSGKWLGANSKSTILTILTFQ
jgi:hypothetical protein